VTILSSPKFVLRTLGGLSIARIDTGTAVMVGHRKRLALLAILAASGSNAVSRERLIALLWPESDDARARNALNQLVFVVRRELGDDAVTEVNGALSLSAQVVEADVVEFRSKSMTGELADAVSLYRGPFLDGVYVRGAPDFERWTEELRRSLANEYATVLERLAAAAVAARDAPSAVRWARALAACDPLSTRAALLLVSALDANGERGAAIRHAELHATLLREECGIAMPPDLSETLNALRAAPAVTVTAKASTRAEAESISSAPGFVTPPAVRGARRSLVPTVGAVASSTALGLLVWTAVVMGERPTPTIRTGAIRQISGVESGRSQPALSPDGKWIAFAANPPGTRATRFGMHVYVQEVGGTRVFPVSTDSTGGQESPFWSPDGSRIAFQTTNSIQVVAALGGTPRIIVSDPEEKRLLAVGAWSHDGERLAFADTTGVWVYDIRGNHATLVTRTGFRAHSATWSANDSSIAYVVGTGGMWNAAPSAIWIVPLHGGQAVRVTDAVHVNTSPVFTPDGKNLLLISDRDGVPDIYQQPIAKGQVGAQAVRLTTGSHAARISLSADGRSVVYGSRVMRSNVWSAPILAHGETPASRFRQVTFGDQEVECLSVSTSGEWLLYDSNRSGNHDIYKVLIAGGEAIQLTTDSADDFCPTMSRNGKEIGFYSFRLSGARRVFTMLADGTRQQPVVASTSDLQQWGPQWSPDGKTLAFSASRGGVRHVDLVDREPNGEWGRLRHGEDGEVGAWSPDGNWLAGCNDRGLVLMPRSGGGQRVLVPTATLGSFCIAEWGPSPWTLFFRTRGSGGESLFWSIPVAGGEPRLLLRLGDELHTSRTAVFAVDAKRLYFTLSSDEASIWHLELRP
jgi:Tol biopolymer transport system component/DNA-binding SARP family transcriptional activator